MINPSGSPRGAAVTKTTPVANLPTASRNARGSGAGTAWAGAASRMSVKRRFLAQRDVAEVVVGAVGPEWVHERAGLDVAVGTGERAAVDVTGAAGERKCAVDGAGRGVVYERLGGLGLGEQGANLIGAAVGRGVGGAVLVDQHRRPGQHASRGGELDGAL